MQKFLWILVKLALIKSNGNSYFAVGPVPMIANALVGALSFLCWFDASLSSSWSLFSSAPSSFWMFELDCAACWSNWLKNSSLSLLTWMAVWLLGICVGLTNHFWTKAAGESHLMGEVGKEGHLTNRVWGAFDYQSCLVSEESHLASRHQCPGHLMRKMGEEGCLVSRKARNQVLDQSHLMMRQVQCIDEKSHSMSWYQ